MPNNGTLKAVKDSSGGYSAWLGKAVVLIVAIRRCPVPLRCRIVGESVAAVRVYFDRGWEMTVRKELILAVEEDAMVPEERIH
jgi:hypothetical protein